MHKIGVLCFEEIIFRIRLQMYLKTICFVLDGVGEVLERIRVPMLFVSPLGRFTVSICLLSIATGTESK